MQNLLILSHTARAWRSQIFGDAWPRPFGTGRGWSPRNSLLPHIVLSYQTSSLYVRPFGRR